jgi:hypothetical protein
MRATIFVFSLLVIYILFLNGCKKNEDATPPIIIAIAPNANSSYNTFDSIFVQATVTDEQNLEFVSVELLNEDFVSVISSFGRYVSGNQYNLFATLVIDNIHIESGKHYILVTAKDSKNTTRSYTEVHVSGLPYESKGYVAFLENNAQFSVKSYSQGSDTLLYQGVGLLSGGIVDSYNQQFGILKGPDGPFEAFPLFPFIESWEIPIMQGGLTFCHSQADKNKIQIGFKNQLLSFYSGENQLSGNVTSDLNYYPSFSFLNDEDIVVWQVALNGGVNRIETFHESGALNQVTSYTHQVVQILRRAENKVYLVSNENGFAYCDIYNLENGVITSAELSGHYFYDACINNEGVVYLASNEMIFKYDPITSLFSSYASIPAKQLEWDLVNNRLIAATLTELLVLDNMGNQIQSYEISGECVELQVWYSK